MSLNAGDRVFVTPCHAAGEIVGRVGLVAEGRVVAAYRVRLPNGAVIRFAADALIPFVGPRAPRDPLRAGTPPQPPGPKDAA